MFVRATSFENMFRQFNVIPRSVVTILSRRQCFNKHAVLHYIYYVFNIRIKIVRKKQKINELLKVIHQKRNMSITKAKLYFLTRWLVIMLKYKAHSALYKRQKKNKSIQTLHHSTSVLLSNLGRHVVGRKQEVFVFGSGWVSI